ncbi:hypothetical protein JCM10212_000383 [Sporobolomyces blumeae]
MAALTDQQSDTFAQLVGMGFDEHPARQAALRFGSNMESAIQWIFDTPNLPNDYRPSTPTDDPPPPPLIPIDDDDDTPLVHPSLLGIKPSRPTTTTTTHDPPAYEDAVRSDPRTSTKLLPAPFSPSNEKDVVDLTSATDPAAAAPARRDLLPRALPPPPNPTHLSDQDLDLQRAIEISTHENTQTTSTTTKTRPDVVLDDDDNDDSGLNATAGEDDLSKALALSMATLGSTQEEAIGVVEAIEPQDRVRLDLASPPILRSTSNLMSGLTSYLQALYAVPSWRSALLSYRQPSRSTDEPLSTAGQANGSTTTTTTTTFEGVWKGEVGGGELGQGFGFGGLGGTEREMRENRLVSLQRLFALMHDTRRAFVHVSEVVRAFGLRESDFHGPWIWRIKAIHEMIVDDLRQSAALEASGGGGETGGERPRRSEQDVERDFVLTGRRVVADQYTGNPLPPVDQLSRISTSIFDVTINPASDPPQTFFERLDHHLLEQDRVQHLPQHLPHAPPPPTSSATEQAGLARPHEFHLLTTPPRTICFHFDRTTEVTSLDSFGSSNAKAGRGGGGPEAGSGSSTSNSPPGGFRRHVFPIEREVWLDRYHVSRRNEIYDARVRLDALRDEVREVKRARHRIATTEKGLDAVDVIRGAWEYLRDATERGLGDDDGDGVADGPETGGERRDPVGQLGRDGDDCTMRENRTKRQERQERLRDQYAKILGAIETRLKGYDEELSRLDAAISSIYASPSWRTIGPYRLTSVLVRNGLNGRGSSWSIVRDDDGEWWKIVDLFKDKVQDIDAALKDPVGLFMDAGITMAFYQLENADEDDDEVKVMGQVQVPEHLERLVARDNHAFAAELASTGHADLTSTWNLAPISSLDSPLPSSPPVIPIYLDPSSSSNLVPVDSQSRMNVDPTNSFKDSDETDTVRNISLSPPSSPPPENLLVDHRARETLVDDNVDGGDSKMKGPVSSSASSSGAATPMSVDDVEDLEPLLGETSATPVEQADPMRLRGGATVESDREDEDEEDEDEDEDDDEIDEDEVELGLLQPMPTGGDDAWNVDYAVGKVGGLPVWLDPRSPLSARDVECGVCNKTMAMLLQVNSPDDSRPHAAARSLYVFACRGAKCLATDAHKAIKVWRTQMASPNEFFPHTEEAVALRKKLESELDAKTALEGSPVNPSAPWPEWDIAAEPEPYEESYLPDPSAPAPDQDEGGEDAEAGDTVSGVDKEFLAFQERIEREPDQVLRFYRLPDIDNPEPLWASKDKISPNDVPLCDLCGVPRQVEFQILSTLLSHLHDDSLDFDSLLVYTCADNCAILPRPPVADRTGWAQEVVFKQDFTSSGVKFGQR